MTPAHLIEAQKLREMDWVEAGKDRFLSHCNTVQRNNAHSASEAGRVIMRRCQETFTKRLETYLEETSKRPRAGTDPILPVLALLGAKHLAAMTLHSSIVMSWTLRTKSSRSSSNALPKAMHLGQAIQHDVQIRLWAKDATTAEKGAIALLKKHMELSPSGWKKRAAALRARATAPWTDEDCGVLGMDLLALLAEACPETFTAPVIRQGAKTERIFKLTDAAADAVITADTAAALTKPKIGMMLVPPVPWAYEDKP